MVDGYRVLQRRIRARRRLQRWQEIRRRRTRRQIVRTGKQILIGAIAGALTWPIFWAWQF